MRKRDDELTRDVEELVEKSTAEEAIAAVWKTFDQALADLDDDSRQLLNEYFGGTTIEEMCRSRGVAEAEMKACLDRSKRELIKRLRSDCPVRQ